MAETSHRLIVGIIGCGAISHEHLKFLSTAPMVRLAAVCDASRVTAQFVQQRYRAQSYFVDYREMLTAVRPDVVHVLTPPHTHKSLVADCLEKGAHVICEKPMTATAAETIGLLDQAKRQGKTLIETRNLLFNDGVLAIDTLKTEGRLGSVREVELLLALDLVNSPFGDLNLEGPAVDLPAGAIH